MPVPRSLLLATLGLTMATTAHATENIPPYVTSLRLLQALEDAANDQVTYEICGWGSIDLLTPHLLAVYRRDKDISRMDEFARQYEQIVRERRQMEATLTAHGANAPAQRTTGLYPTGGCSASVRERIEHRAAVPKIE